MLMTGDQYRDSLKDDREVYIDGERVKSVPDHQADDRRKLLAFGRDLLNSDYAGHKVTFQLFAQSPPFAHLGAVYRNFDFSGPMEFVQKSAGLSQRVLGKK